MVGRVAVEEVRRDLDLLPRGAAEEVREAEAQRLAAA
jgi:hypothetical protein